MATGLLAPLLFAAAAVGCRGPHARMPDMASPFDAALLDEALADLAPQPPSRTAFTVGLANNTLRFSIPIQVGDAPPFDVMIDTGSAGLRILPGILPDSAYTSISTDPVGETYGDRLNVTGVAAYAPVTIGDRTTDGPIAIERISDEFCAADNPGCSVPVEVLAHFSGFGAILGVGERTSILAPVVGNPIVQMAGHPSFILRAPDFPGGTGTLMVGPSSDDVAAFQTVQLAADPSDLPLANGIAAWDDTNVPLCVTDTTAGVPYCTGALVDSGDPPTEISWAAHTGGTTRLPSGHTVAVTIGPASAPAAAYSFVVGASPKSGLDEVLIESAMANSMNVGTAPFFRYDVYFDQTDGLIGFAPRPTPSPSPSPSPSP